VVLADVPRVTPPRAFVGRERELEKLQSALDTANPVGERGVGRTRTTQGAELLIGRRYEDEGAPGR
jgi:hypothetical protein